MGLVGADRVGTAAVFGGMGLAAGTKGIGGGWPDAAGRREASADPGGISRNTAVPFAEELRTVIRSAALGSGGRPADVCVDRALVVDAGTPRALGRRMFTARGGSDDC